MQPIVFAESVNSVDSPPVNFWQAVARFLVKRRVRLTVLIFVALIVEDVLIGVKPHSLFDVRDAESLGGVALVAVGLAIRSWSAGILRKTRELTTTGPYAIIRNPLYVGSFLIMGGFSTVIDDVENIFFILGPVAGLYYLQVLHEERILHQKFGPRWTEYAAATPRFVPRSLPVDPLATWRSQEWFNNREYRAFMSVLMGLLFVELWRVS